MLRSVALACGFFSVSLLVGCSSDDEHHRHHGHGGVSQVAPACGAETTCGTCTPVLGCGWCQYEDGGGRCATGPDACGTSKPFRWNWDPDTCPVIADAGSDAFTPADASPSETSDDAATEAATSETSSDDAGTDASSDAAAEAAAETSVDAADDAAETSTDAGAETSADASADTVADTAPACKIPDLATSASCSPTTGGSLCKDGQYTLGCHGGAPDAALKCEKALSTPDGTYHCCSCGT